MQSIIWPPSSSSSSSFIKNPGQCRASSPDSTTTFIRHKKLEKKQRKEIKGIPKPPPPPVKEIEQAYALYFDGAYRRKEGKAAAGMVVFNPAKEKVMEKGIVLLNVSSNNEAEYAALITGLEWCVQCNPAPQCFWRFYVNS